ncbi:MAG: hypothetical protein ACLFUI_06475 [Halanaerobiales bacterium]
MKVGLLFIFIVFLFTFHCSAEDEISADIILRHYGLWEAEMDAQDYNEAGMELYHQDEFSYAKTVFLKAIELNNQHTLANYNLACVLSLEYENKLKELGPDEVEYPYEVFHYLYVSILLDSERRLNAIKDTDFNSVREFKEFQVLTSEEENPVLETIVAKFIGINAYGGEVSLIFVDDYEQEYWFDPTDLDLCGLEFYKTVQSDNGCSIPHHEANMDHIGEYYQITFQYIMKTGEYSGIYILNTQVISFEELNLIKI